MSDPCRPLPAPAQLHHAPRAGLPAPRDGAAPPGMGGEASAAGACGSRGNAQPDWLHRIHKGARHACFQLHAALKAVVFCAYRASCRSGSPLGKGQAGAAWAASEPVGLQQLPERLLSRPGSSLAPAAWQQRTGASRRGAAAAPPPTPPSPPPPTPPTPCRAPAWGARWCPARWWPAC